jgi:NADH-quinone oxidoreductase subunit J
MLQAEFLALMLVFVYVGAVLTLFLFVVMMINSDKETKVTPIKKALPVGFIVMILLAALLWGVIFHMGGHHNAALFTSSHILIPTTTTYNNTLQLGILLYTHYVLAFELAGAILLVAIIGAISLAYLGRPKDPEKIITDQRDANKASGLRLVDIPKGDQA